MIPKDHPRYASLVRREKIAEGAWNKIVAMEGVGSHGRGESFDYLIGEKTTESAAAAERAAAAVLLNARHAVFSVNGNTAVLAADLIADLQKACGLDVEVNLFHRTEERIEKITKLLEENGAVVHKGPVERLIPLSHDRALCTRDGIYDADVIIVPLEDGDRCEALRKMGKTVITIDLNPLSRTAKFADVTIVDELTRAMPNITREVLALKGKTDEIKKIIDEYSNQNSLDAAVKAIMENLNNALGGKVQA